LYVVVVAPHRVIDIYSFFYGVLLIEFVAPFDQLR